MEKTKIYLDKLKEGILKEVGFLQSTFFILIKYFNYKEFSGAYITHMVFGLTWAYCAI